MQIVDKVVPPADVTIVGEDGKPAWGVETRTVATDPGDRVYAINVSPSPVTKPRHPTIAQSILMLHLAFCGRLPLDSV